MHLGFGWFVNGAAVTLIKKKKQTPKAASFQSAGQLSDHLTVSTTWEYDFVFRRISITTNNRRTLAKQRQGKASFVFQRSVESFPKFHRSEGKPQNEKSSHSPPFQPNASATLDSFAFDLEKHLDIMNYDDNDATFEPVKSVA